MNQEESNNIADRAYTFWSQIHQIPEHRRDLKFREFARVVIGAVDNGQCSLAEAGRALEPCISIARFTDNGDLAVISLLASEIEQTGVGSSLEARRIQWRQIKEILLRPNETRADTI